MGQSGAGKSTILNLLPRFYDPQKGTIKIDGQDTTKVRLSSLRKNISLVSQDITLLMILLKIIFHMLKMTPLMKRLKMHVILLRQLNLLRNYQTNLKLKLEKWCSSFWWTKTKNFNCESNFKRVTNYFIR